MIQKKIRTPARLLFRKGFDFMKKTLAVLFSALLMFSLLLSACFGGGKVELDDTGLATWKPVIGAVRYEYTFVGNDYIGTPHESTEACQVQVPEGMCVHVTPIFKNDKRGKVMTSPFYGEPVAYSDVFPTDPNFGNEEDPNPEYVPEDAQLRIDRSFTLHWDDVSVYEIISNIRMDTLQTLADGTVTFTAVGPDGGEIRFSGKGIHVSEGAITFEPDGMLISLDAIGRICYMDYTVQENLSPENFIECSGGYTFNDTTSVDSMEQLYFCRASGRHVRIPEGAGVEEPMATMWTQPNFFRCDAYDLNTASFTLSELKVGYDTATYCTPIRNLFVNSESHDFANVYREGMRYDENLEIFDAESKNFSFDLVMQPELLDLAPETNLEEKFAEASYGISAIDCIETDCGLINVGNLLDAEGNVLDKSCASVTPECRLEVEIAGTTYQVGLPVVARGGESLQTIHDLGSVRVPYAVGELNALVIPIMWQDQPQNATEQELEFFRAKLGRVADMGGTAQDYSEDNMAFSRYFDLASYGKLSITSYMTDWYPAPYDFEEKIYCYLNSPEDTLPKEVEQWVYESYPDTDWSRFDKDGDGAFDAVILLNTGRDGDDSVVMAGYEYGLYYSGTLYAEDFGTAQKPKINGFTSINIERLEEPGHVLVHEFGHNLGLIDYYDVTYSGINAIGTYDMQSDNSGDWNAFSKYIVGWLEPTVVQGLNSGESVDITIGSMATTGDAIVIPTAGTAHEGPFNEYILIDLFADDGLHAGASGYYGLTGVKGIRIYHVNASMIDTSKVYNTNYATEESFLRQAFVNAYQEAGMYQLELLQNGGINTFTVQNSRMTVAPEDLFYAGDVFDVADYGEFLRGGLMDSGKEWGYTAEVVSIDTNADGEATATLRITRK